MNRKNTSRITDAEWEVMRVLWSHKEVTAGQVIDILGDDMNWKPATIKTLLRRLTEKGYAGVNTDLHPYRYFSLVSEADSVGNEIQNLLDSICRRKSVNIIIQLIQNCDLDEAMVDHIRQALAEKKTVPRVTCQCLPGQCSCSADCEKADDN